MKKHILTVLALAAAMSGIAAEQGTKKVKKEGGEKKTWSLLQLGWYEPAQIVEREVPIYGLKLNLIHSGNDVVYGLDGGIISDIADMRGIQMNLINQITSRFSGVQMAFINTLDASYGVEENEKYDLGKNYGVSMGVLLNYNEGMKQRGVDLAGLISLHGYDNDFAGVRASLFNRSRGEVSGVELGAVNWTENCDGGLQLGLVNYAVNLRGLQIGLLNITEEPGVKVLPILNGRL